MQKRGLEWKWSRIGRVMDWMHACDGKERKGMEGKGAWRPSPA